MKKNKHSKPDKMLIIIGVILILLIISGTFLLSKRDNLLNHDVSSALSSQKNSSTSKSALTSSSVTKKSLTESSVLQKTMTDPLPAAKQSDWELILVNRDHVMPELNPPLTNVGGVPLNSKITTQAAAFLAAAQKISPAEHFISGYRSVNYQLNLFESYIEAEMVGHGTVNTTGKPISRDQAIADVKTYSQPAGSSEHQTGLAVDLSDVNSLNASPDADKIAQIAPEYGFILRFPKGKEASTGVNYEDWHFRYVGVENAEYITSHQLTLEEYLKLLPA
jgi:D-alanyl-D-alanine carboxypeptidase